MTNRALLPIDSKEHAQALYDRYGGYYQAASRLGNPNLRATLWRYLNEDGFTPSKHFMAALLDWAHVDLVIIQVLPGGNPFGEVGLIDFGQVVDVTILSLGEIDESLFI